MQNIVLDRPYKFIPPVESKLWVGLMQPFLPWYLNKLYGIASVECRGTALLRKSIAAGHGVVLAPNHSRECDPMVLGSLTPHIGTPLHAMGSWHLFMHSRLQCLMARAAGAFSVYREGTDRQALNAAIDILENAKRPLILFPEGVVTRNNDRFTELLDGVSFVARTAAKRRAKAEHPAKIVVHPVAMKYFFKGDLEKSLDPVLARIEQRLSWQPQRQLPLIERIYKLGEGLLSVKEVEYMGKAQPGGFHERLPKLIDAMIAPIEQEWTDGKQETHIVARVKRLRALILPDMIAGKCTPQEHYRRWRQLADMYMAQQLNWYPHDYIRSYPSPERLLETVERFDEDLHDLATVHRPLHCVIQVGEAIEVNPERQRGGEDPLLVEVHRQVQGMLDRLIEESQPLKPPPRSQPELLTVHEA